MSQTLAAYRRGSNPNTRASSLGEIPFPRDDGVNSRIMGLITKFALLALPTLAGCGVLSQVSSQGAGSAPGGKANTYSGPKIPSLEAVERRVAFIDDAEAVYKQANFRPKWIDRVPQDFRNWENGARQTLTNNGQVLRYAQVEHVREVVRSFAKYDQRLSREASLKLVETLPKPPTPKRGDPVGYVLNERDKALAKVIFAVTKDALNYAGIRNPSKQLVQVAFSDASAYWSNRFVKYDTAVTDKYVRSLKYWPVEPVELGVGDCNFFSLAQRNVQRAGAKTVPELNGLNSHANGGSFVDVGQLIRPNGHVIVVTSIPMPNGKRFKLIHNPTATDSDSNLTVGITRLGLSEAEMSLFSSSFAPRFHNAPTLKYFISNWVGGDRPGENLNLGNLNLRYLTTDTTNNRFLPPGTPPLTSSEVEQLVLFNNNNGVPVLSHRTEWDAWRKSNEEGIARLRYAIYGR